MKIHRYIFIGIALCMFFACSDYKQQIAKDMQKLQTKVIRLPSKGLVLLRNKVLQEIDTNRILKLVVYTDSIGCTSCAINQINLWDSFIEYANQFNNQLGFYFIFSPVKKDINSIKVAISSSMFNYPILLDTLGEFERQNRHLPKNRAFHSFLLDENNKVILVGNPLNNERIEKLFYQIVEEKLGKPE